MKTHLAKVSLALLSTVFLLGCQEQGSEPVGPEGLGIQAARGGVKGKPEKPSDGGNAVAATLNLTDGMVTTELDVTVRANKLGAGNTDFVHDIRMQFTDLGTCVGFEGTKSSVPPSDDEVAALEAELHDFSGTHRDEDSHTPGRLVKEGFFAMQIDKDGLTADGNSTTSEGHLLLVEFDGTFDGSNGFTRIMLGSPFNQVDPVTVKWTQLGVKDVFTFTGPVVVWAHGVGGGGGVKSDRIIQCSGTENDPNKVTATITITP